MNSTSTTQAEAPPPVAIGHVDLTVTDVGQATDYFVKLGLRHIHQVDDFAVLELRGGTHLVLETPETPIVPGQQAPFDLMVDDLAATHQKYAELGMSPSAIETGRIHSSFYLKGPDGYEIRVTSSHTSGRPV